MHDPATDKLFEGVLGLVKKLSSHYNLVLVSLARSESPEGRLRKIEKSGIAGYFKLILIGDEDKDELYEKALADLAITPEEVAVVDDQIIRGIAWGNRRDAITVWLRKGKFAHELPTKETGTPTFIINNIMEIRSLRFFS